MSIPIYRPYIKKYKTSLFEAIDTEWISSLGKYISLASNKLKEILNVNHVILMSNGTVATHCIFMALKYKYPDIKKIYVPDHVYIAAINASLFEYDERMLEVLPIDSETLNMPESEGFIQSLDKEAAVLVVHNIGNIINVPRLKKLRPDLIFVEDNCEGLFGTYNGIYSGCSESSLCSSVSFFANKSITSGEGGAFITNDEDLYKYIKRKYSQGMTDEKYVHDVLAYNYRMTNLQAAILYDQLCDIDHILGLKKKVFDWYHEELKELIEKHHIYLQKQNENTSKSNWMFIIRIPKSDYNKFNTFMNTRAIKVETRPLFYSLMYHKHTQTIPRHPLNRDEFQQKIHKEYAILPSYPELSKQDIKIICDYIKEWVNTLTS